MAWRIEKWLEHVYPDSKDAASKYSTFELRELLIVCTSVFDLALAQILSLRLVENEKEMHDFLGLNKDGRAPLASFGARIQLSILLGIIGKEEADIFRAFKNLRNLFAHSVNVLFKSEDFQKNYKVVFDQFVYLIAHSIPEHKRSEYFETLKEHHVDSMNEGQAKNIIVTVFIVYQEVLKEIAISIERIKAYQEK